MVVQKSIDDLRRQYYGLQTVSESAAVPDYGPSHSERGRVVRRQVGKQGWRSTALSTTPALNTCTPFSFARREALRPTSPFSQDCPSDPPFQKHPPRRAFTPIMDCGRLGDYKEQPDSWMSPSDLKNRRFVFARPASMRVQGCFQPPGAWCNPDSKPPSSNGFSSRVAQ